MTIECPYCEKKKDESGIRSRVNRAGRFRRSSDKRKIQRYRCYRCSKTFSDATFHPCFRQKKRQFNQQVFKLCSSGVSIRRAARLLEVDRETIAAKQLFLGQQALLELERSNQKFPRCEIIEFDDLETFEHTKLKPLSVCLAVEYKTRRILGFRVAQMSARGTLAALSRKKYGPRKDERFRKREDLFRELTRIVSPTALIKSDQNPHYEGVVRRHFPKATYQQHKGQRGSIVGQGELKKVRFDPLFHLNHTCAMLRANINRLFRRTWCTTKKRERLAAHIAMYAIYHNLILIKALKTNTQPGQFKEA